MLLGLRKIAVVLTPALTRAAASIPANAGTHGFPLAGPTSQAMRIFRLAA